MTSTVSMSIPLTLTVLPAQTPHLITSLRNARPNGTIAGIDAPVLSDTSARRLFDVDVISEILFVSGQPLERDDTMPRASYGGRARQLWAVQPAGAELCVRVATSRMASGLRAHHPP
jgi:hypothetical protein